MFCIFFICKNKVRLHQRIESEASATLVRPTSPLPPGDRGLQILKRQLHSGFM